MRVCDNFLKCQNKDSTGLEKIHFALYSQQGDAKQINSQTLELCDKCIGTLIKATTSALDLVNNYKEPKPLVRTLTVEQKCTGLGYPNCCTMHSDMYYNTPG